MNRTTDIEYPLGDRGREVEYIALQTDFKENDIELDPARTSDYGRRLNDLRGLRIH